MARHLKNWLFLSEYFILNTLGKEYACKNHKNKYAPHHTGRRGQRIQSSQVPKIDIFSYNLCEHDFPRGIDMVL
ncbi:hypothetical protein B9Z55_017504 [Caenorhabditis nigoni]|uniref:Uncharacterized protein n=1 Tax=Caenorhabditis nigoni TaxID=1611254 RepID=A0A2G5TA04_9PELO|nr:hypothetical protein B9Z55_017504 [Caenorhabditis nigoni]